MIEVTKNNCDELFTKYASEIESGEVKVWHHLYVNGEFKTAVEFKDMRTLLAAYEDSGAITLRSFLDGTDPSICGTE